MQWFCEGVGIGRWGAGRALCGVVLLRVFGTLATIASFAFNGLAISNPCTRAFSITFKGLAPEGVAVALRKGVFCLITRPFVIEVPLEVASGM